MPARQIASAFVLKNYARLANRRLERLLPSVAKKTLSWATKQHRALSRAVVGKGRERSSSRPDILTLRPMLSVPLPSILKESCVILASE